MPGFINPISPTQLDMIKQAHSLEGLGQGIQQGVKNYRDRKNAEEEKKNANILFGQQKTLNELNISSKRASEVGGVAIGLLEMAEGAGSETSFMKGYDEYLKNLPEETRSMMPPMFESKAKAKMWATQAASRADKLIPYLEVKKKKESTQQWQFMASMLAKPPEDRTDAEQRVLDYYERPDQNIYLGDPTAEKTKDTVRGLQSYNMPGTEYPILTLLDSKSKASFVSAVDSLTQSRMDLAKKNREIISRSEARDQAVQLLLPKIEKKDVLLQKIPWLGQFVDSDYVFNPGENTLKELHGYAPPVQPTAGPDIGESYIQERGGYRWDTRTTPPTNLGKVK